MIDALGVLMGIDIQAQTRPEGSSDESPRQSAHPSTPPPAAPPKESKPTPAQEDVEMEEVDEEQVKAKKEADASKKLGSEAYSKREFDTAISHFEKAWEIYPKDITFLSNAGGEVIA
jgi:stress-induced-phosphoprotein 1